MCCVYTFSPAPDTTTVEGLDKVISNMVTAGLYFLGFIIWMVMSFINYLQDRIELLEKKQERDDTMYELVQELVKANETDRKLDAQRDQKIKKLEEKQR
jgi:uncharacterized protein YlxW (UPF0749 family)